jgi:serine/threonine-protein kinase
MVRAGNFVGVQSRRGEQPFRPRVIVISQKTRMTHPTFLDRRHLRKQPIHDAPDGGARPTLQRHDVAPPGYEAIARAGQGSFSEIWQIRDLQAGQVYALKRIRAECQDIPACRRLCSNEADVGRQLRSRHVVRVVDSNSNCPRPYTILEWIDGSTLEQRLNEHGPLPIGVAVWIARQCAQGLHDLADAGFSHGDVKPANIFLTSGGEVKLVDLGFAQPVQNFHRPSRGVLTGTAEYMAPESLSRGRFGPVAKDIYSLGITLFRMLSGQLPFEAESAADMLRLQRQAKPPLLRRRCPAVTRELADLVHRLLAKQPLRRPQSLRALIRELIVLELAVLPDRFEV